MPTEYSKLVSAAALEALERAAMHLSRSLAEVRNANLVIGGEGIPHNEDKTRSIIGALEVAQTALIHERIAWDGYNRARQDQ